MTVSLHVGASTRRAHEVRDTVDLRRVAAFGGLEAVRATYVSHSFSPHFHDTFAIGVITRGACAMACQGATYLLRPGHVVLIAPGEVHTGEQVGGTGWSYRMIYPSVDATASACRGREVPTLNGGRVFRSPVVQDANTARSFLTLHRLLFASPCRLEQETCAAAFLAGVLERHTRPRRLQLQAGHLRAMNAIRDYMHAHHAETVSLTTLAGVAGLSCFYVIRLFRAAYGMPPHAYLATLRVQRASTLIRAGAPIAQAALAAGFSDQSHLTRFFKRVFGMTPGVYARAVGAR